MLYETLKQSSLTVCHCCDNDGPAYATKSKPKSVLAVDDDPQVCRLIYRILNCEHYKVITAGNAEEAIPLAVQSNPSLVLLDLHLTSNDASDGIDCLISLRDSGYKNPIYILSGDDSFDQVRLAAQNGANGYLIKRSTRTFWNHLNELITDTISGKHAINKDLTAPAVAYLKSCRLTDADIQLLSQFTDDYGREKEIARILDISECAVRKKFQAIRDRLGARSQSDLGRMIGVLSCFKDLTR